MLLLTIYKRIIAALSTIVNGDKMFETENEFLRFSHKITHSSTFFYRKRACSERSHNGQCKNVLVAYV